MNRRKMHVCWKAKYTDQQLCTGTYLPLGSCHSAQQLVTLASIYMLIRLR